MRQHFSYQYRRDRRKKCQIVQKENKRYETFKARGPDLTDSKEINNVSLP
jgi:hypothetical protein